MDEIAHYNMARWQELADANALFTRPSLNLTPETALDTVDPFRILGPLAGREILCLAGGGGQQSAAFSLLGARVTVFDLSEAQLERDRQAAAHYNITVQTVQGDMRDLSELPAAAFDIVYQPHSLGFVPDARVVFAQVARVLRPGGIYHFNILNPFYAGLSEADWNGEGYTLRLPYVDGAEIETPDPEWVYAQEDHAPVRVCREYRQTLSRLMNGLAGLSFQLIHLSDSHHLYPDPTAEPGTWTHRNAIAPAWLALWLRYTGQEAI